MTMPQPNPAFIAFAKQVAGHGHHGNKFLHLLFSFGIFGLFFISIIVFSLFTTSVILRAHRAG